VPHFEKMLSDNGLLLEQLALATRWSAARDLYRNRIETTIGWMVREMLLPGGAFSASLDADSEGHEGRFYVWSRAELDSFLPPADAAFIANLYDISPEGNWEGVSIPNRLRTADPLSQPNQARADALLDRMLAERARRIRPGLDDKILADWNGYAITGLATAGMLLDRPEWIELAESAYRFMSESMSRDGRPAHALRAGQMVYPGFSSDLAALARSAVALHQATQQAYYLDEAIRLLGLLESHHGDGAGNLHFTADDAEPLIVRKSDRVDDASPNPHGLAVDSLVRLWALTGDDSLRDRADAILAASSGVIADNVFGTASLLAGLDLRLSVRTIVIVTPEGDDGAALRDVVIGHWRSSWVLDIRRHDQPLAASHPAHGKTAINGKATAYLCREGSCSLPITDPGVLATALANA
jgi:uncharacterized protein YyaL (SSP411 family)